LLFEHRQLCIHTHTYIGDSFLCIYIGQQNILMKALLDAET